MVEARLRHHLEFYCKQAKLLCKGKSNNQVESANCSISATAPKRKDYSRNYAMHASLGILNYQHRIWQVRYLQQQKLRTNKWTEKEFLQFEKAKRKHRLRKQQLLYRNRRLVLRGMKKFRNKLTTVESRKGFTYKAIAKKCNCKPGGDCGNKCGCRKADILCNSKCKCAGKGYCNNKKGAPVDTSNKKQEKRHKCKDTAIGPKQGPKRKKPEQAADTQNQNKSPTEESEPAKKKQHSTYTGGKRKKPEKAADDSKEKKGADEEAASEESTEQESPNKKQRITCSCKKGHCDNQRCHCRKEEKQHCGIWCACDGSSCLNRIAKESYDQEPTKKIALAFWDIETSGLSVEKEEILEIAIQLPESSATFSTLVRPSKPLQNIYSVCNITKEQLEKAPTIEHVLPKLLAWSTEHTAEADTVVFLAHSGGYNSMDYRFLQKSMRSSGLNIPSHWYFVDSIQLLKKLLPDQKGMSLSKLIEQYIPERTISQSFG